MAAETIGEIFLKEEADKNFGPVLFSIEINSSELKAICGNTNKFLMFNIVDRDLNILGDNRIVLYPKGIIIDSAEVFAVYSKNKVSELLEKGEKEITFIEKRSEVISLTNGQYTLEVSGWCPPFC